MELNCFQLKQYRSIDVDTQCKWALKVKKLVKYSIDVHYGCMFFSYRILFQAKNSIRLIGHH